jgi:hypothetical protein
MLQYIKIVVKVSKKAYRVKLINPAQKIISAKKELSGQKECIPY